MKNWERAFNEITKDGWNAETFLAIKRFIKRILKQKWEKEFEAFISCDAIGTYLNDNEIEVLLRKYLGNYFNSKIKVKIKCKDGCIQIERVE